MISREFNLCIQTTKHISLQAKTATRETRRAIEAITDTAALASSVVVVPVSVELVDVDEVEEEVEEEEVVKEEEVLDEELPVSEVAGSVLELVTVGSSV